jgi:hypothetical protein
VVTERGGVEIESVLDWTVNGEEVGTGLGEEGVIVIGLVVKLGGGGVVVVTFVVVGGAIVGD